MNRILKITALGMGILIGIAVFLVGGLLGILSAAEYRPEEIEKAEIRRHPGTPSGSGGTARDDGAESPPLPAMPGPQAGVPLSVLAWNIGYASLDEAQDFFMDGGKRVRPAGKETVERNLAGIGEFIAGADCDALLLQEVDTASRRSYYVNQVPYLADSFAEQAPLRPARPVSSVFAHNFRCIFVPIPFPRSIGRVSSGLLTLNRFESAEAFRLRLPNPFSWPVRVANLKRCLLVSRIPLEGRDAELVLVNLHLEAYDSGGGREAQTRALLDFLYSEYAKGNYCVAGGDFNQSFPGLDDERFSVKNREYFIPGTLNPSLLAEGWRFAADTEIPSSRLLNEPYSPDSADTQLYVIDGFLLSPNVELLSVETFDLGFKYADHNPVKLHALLK